MPANNKKRVMGCFAAALIAAIVLPVMFGAPRKIDGQSGGDPWRNIIFDFQTLLTGLLAVGAASWTVMTMDRTDKQAEKRHKELVNLSLRADRLRVDRLLMPHLRLFQKWLQRVDDLDFRPLQEHEIEIDDRCRAVAASLSREIKEVKTLVLESPGWQEAAPLFNGELSHQVYLLKLQLELSRRKALACEQVMDPDLIWIVNEDGRSAADHYRSSQMESWRELVSVSIKMKATSRRIVSELQGLAKTYDLEHLFFVPMPSPDR